MGGSSSGLSCNFDVFLLRRVKSLQACRESSGGSEAFGGSESSLGLLVVLLLSGRKQRFLGHISDRLCLQGINALRIPSAERTLLLLQHKIRVMFPHCLLPSPF